MCVWTRHLTREYHVVVRGIPAASSQPGFAGFAGFVFPLGSGGLVVLVLVVRRFRRLVAASRFSYIA